MKLTIEPDIAQTELLEASMLSVTGSPDVAVATAVYVGPLKAARAGGAELKLIVCVFPTVSVLAVPMLVPSGLKTVSATV